MRYSTNSLRNISGSSALSPAKLERLRFSAFDPFCATLILTTFAALTILQTLSLRKSSRLTKAASRLREQRRSSGAPPKTSTPSTGCATKPHSETHAPRNSSLAAPTRGRSTFSMNLMVSISQALSITGAMKFTTSLSRNTWRKVLRSSGVRLARRSMTFAVRLAASLTALTIMACARLSLLRSSVVGTMRTSRVCIRASSSGCASFPLWTKRRRRFASSLASRQQSLYASGWLPPPSTALQSSSQVITRWRCIRAKWARLIQSTRWNTCAIASAQTA
jgi:hypothetical protein